MPVCLGYVRTVASTPHSPELITDAVRLDALCAELGDAPLYAIDTEFHTEGTYWPKLALIQIGWEDKVALIDPLAVDLTPLSQVFAGPGIAVAHAASQDLDILLTACGVALADCSWGIDGLDVPQAANNSIMPKA